MNHKSNNLSPTISTEDEVSAFVDHTGTRLKVFYKDTELTLYTLREKLLVIAHKGAMEVGCQHETCVVAPHVIISSKQ